MDPNQLNQLKSVAPKAAGALLVLIAVWQAWSGWELHRDKALEGEAAQGRSAVAQQVNATVRAQLQQLEQRAARADLHGALQEGRDEAAAALLAEGWAGVEAAELHMPDLASAYAEPDRFGYGKLALLETALSDNAVRAAVVKDGGATKLALAAPVMDEGRLLRLAYVRLPLEPLLAPMAGAVSEQAYLALRQGRHTLHQLGDTQLANSAEAGAIEIDGTPIRVVAASPLAMGGLFGLYGMGEFGLAGVLLLAGVAVAVLGGRRRAAATEGEVPAAGDAGPTLADLQRSGQLATEAQPAPVKRPEKAATPKLALDRSIFRAYDIRGVVGQTLDAAIARLIGQAIGSVMEERGVKGIVVGRDGRLSSPELAAALIQGLSTAGRDVIDIGEAPTPVVYFAAHHERTGSCVSVTGSHNPPDYNGFKIVIDGETLAGDAVTDLYARIAENRLHVAETVGGIERRVVADAYVQRIAGDVQVERRLKVVVDCGSGIPGKVAPQVLRAIGVEVEELFCEVDGSFPHHHPDPSDPANLQDLINMVQRIGADLGVAFDGDGDRLGVVTRTGEMIYPDRLLMLFAADVLERNPGASIIYDVKCTGHLATHILRHGGSPLMWKTGHSLIKAKMRETEAELAGEMSGHFFFRERWYGFDDGMYAAARLLEILSTRAEAPEEVFAALPQSVATPELKVPVEEGEQYRFVEQFVASARFEGARIATIDGLRADWPDGWGLVRASNTTPVLVLRFDGKDADALKRIQGAFREQLLALKPDLALPF